MPLRTSLGVDDQSGYTRSLGPAEAGLLNQKESLSLDIQRAFLLCLGLAFLRPTATIHILSAIIYMVARSIILYG